MERPIIPKELKSARTVSGTRASAASKEAKVVKQQAQAELAAVVGKMTGDVVALGSGHGGYFLGFVVSEPVEAAANQVLLHGHYLSEGTWYFKIRWLEEDTAAGDRLYEEGAADICTVGAFVDVPGLPDQPLEGSSYD